MAGFWPFGSSKTKKAIPHPLQQKSSKYGTSIKLRNFAYKYYILQLKIKVTAVKKKLGKNFYIIYFAFKDNL